MIVGQICDALQAAHREGIIHRDIKPENVLINRDGEVKLADFGLSRPLQGADVSQLTQTNVVMGTPDYMAPEQHEGAGKADQRSDIFALGVMFYEMLTGKPPRGAFALPSSRMRGMEIDVRIDDVVLKALQSEPEHRYQKISEMKTDVDRIRTTPLPAPTPQAAVSARSGGTSVLRMAIALGVALLAMVIGLMVASFVWWGKSPAPRPAATASISVQEDAKASSAAPVATGQAPAVAAAASPATPNLPAIAEIRLGADPQKGLEARRGKEVWVSSSNATQFKLVPGLKEPRLVSFEPVDSAGAYLRHKDAIIWLHQQPGKLDLIFEGNASFRPIHLDGDKYRFEASGLNDMFITVKEDGSVVLARDPRLERSTFVLKPVNIAAKNGNPSPTQSIPPPAPAATPSLAAQPAVTSAPAAAGQHLAEALVGHKWSWARGDNQGGTWRTTLTFHPDGTISNPTDHRTWYWWAVDDHTAHLQFHEETGSPGALNLQAGMTLTFNDDLTNFRGKYIPDPEKPIAVGERKEPTGVSLAKIPAATPAAAATPAPATTAKSTPATPVARRAAQVYEAIVGYHWAWMNVGDDKTPSVVDFIWDGHVSGGWLWEMMYKPDGETFVHCNWNGNGHQYLRLNEACDAFDSFDSDGVCRVKGKRLGPIGEAVNLKELAALSPAAATPAPSAAARSTATSPAARRAAQMYEAIVGYHWAWINIGEEKPPLVVDFIWDGHVSGGWTWEMLYKPDGETFVHCNWNGNGHQYLRLNEACDAFDAFDSAGEFHVKGKRLGPIGEPVNLKGLAGVPSADGSPAKSGSPSQQIEPLLEPSLNAILAPLEANPQMPRVAVEKLRASLAGASVKARTPLQKQIYQYGMAVCEALTNGMDERALTKAAALSSAQVPSLSNGASIINTMPLRGRDAGHAGDAIRGKQRDERNYADMKGAQVSGFMESSAYKAWISKAAMLRQNVMGLYTRLVQLEAADTAATPQPANP